MKTSENGINLIKEFEGCKLTAYQCAAGVWTIGYGHTAGVTKGMRISSADAVSLLKSDLAKFEKHVMTYDSKYNWTQNEFDALVSFAFNIGNINQLTDNGKRTKTEIANKIEAYNKAGGRVLSGLVKRRAAEKTLFSSKSTTATESNTEVKETTSTTGHVPLNYKVGETYTVYVASSLRIRTKKASQEPIHAVNGETIGYLKNGQKVKNLATALVDGKIMMYIGLDSKKREKWVCADNGKVAYVK